MIPNRFYRLLVVVPYLFNIKYWKKTKLILSLISFELKLIFPHDAFLCTRLLHWNKYRLNFNYLFVKSMADTIADRHLFTEISIKKYNYFVLENGNKTNGNLFSKIWLCQCHQMKMSGYYYFYLDLILLVAYIIKGTYIWIVPLQLFVIHISADTYIQ